MPIGFWDLAIPGDEAARLRTVGRIANARAKSFCHWSGFLVAEVDGKAAAGLSGYTKPSVLAGSALFEAMGEAFEAEKWTPADREAMGPRIAPFLTCVPETPEDAWVVEWVATLPAYRGKGLVRQLLGAIIERGRQQGFQLAQIGVLIGNTPAQRAYEGAGFRFVDEKRHPDFERVIGCPGILRMHRKL